jgi:hypothetical protein
VGDPPSWVFAFFFFFSDLVGFLLGYRGGLLGGSRWVAVGRRGVGSRWVVGLVAGWLSLSRPVTATATATTHFFSVFFFLDLPDLLDF